MSDPHDQIEELPRELALAFAPLHKRAFGMALGITMGSLVFLITVFSVVRSEPPLFVHLLGQYFLGYTVSWAGALVGFAWAWFTFFVMGWFAAFLRNFLVAVNIWIGYARAELNDTRDFLDHI